MDRLDQSNRFVWAVHRRHCLHAMSEQRKKRGSEDETIDEDDGFISIFIDLLYYPLQVIHHHRLLLYIAGFFPEKCHGATREIEIVPRLRQNNN